MIREELVEKVEQWRRFASHDNSKLPYELVEFMSELRSYLDTLSAAHTIKPLVWKDDDGESWSGPFVVWRFKNGWRWKCFGNELAVGRAPTDCDSLTHGKQLCQQHWESEAGIGMYLERMK